MAKLHVPSGEKPRFFKSRSVPYAVRSSIEEEIDRLEGDTQRMGYPDCCSAES